MDHRAHSAELDALRGVAILLVVKGHVAAMWWAYTKQPLDVFGVDLLQLLRFSPNGVYLFFLLSGYLLTMTEERRARAGGYDLRSYAKRRALRILPAYLVAVVAVLLVWPRDATGGDVASHLLFVHTLNPYSQNSLDPVFWSLAAEVVFYAALPLIVLYLPKIGQRLALLVAMAALSWGVQTYLPRDLFAGVEGFDFALYVDRLPTTHFYLFVVGVLLRGLAERLERSKSPHYPLFGSVLLVGSVAGMAAVPFIGTPIPYLSTVLLAAFFAAVLLGGPLSRAVFSWRPLYLVGVVSYSLFLLHQTVLVALAPEILVDREPTLALFAAFAFAVVVAALAVSVVSYRFVEAPFLRRKPG